MRTAHTQTYALSGPSFDTICRELTKVRNRLHREVQAVNDFLAACPPAGTIRRADLEARAARLRESHSPRIDEMDAALEELLHGRKGFTL